MGVLLGCSSSGSSGSGGSPSVTGGTAGTSDGATAGESVGGSSAGTTGGIDSGGSATGGAGTAGSGLGGAETAAGMGGATAGGSAGSGTESCAAGQVVAAKYPSLAWESDASTMALYEMSDTSDASPAALGLTNAGGVVFTHDGLDWSSYSKNDVARFSGVDQSLSRTGLTVGTEFTLEARVRWNGFQNRTCGATADIISLKSGSDGVAFEQPCGLASGPRVRVNDATSITSAADLEDAQDYAWHTLAFVISGGSASFYLDGVSLGTSAAVGSLGTSGFTLTLGKYFTGEIDELRLSNTARKPSSTGPTVQARPAYTELTGADQSVSLKATVAGAGAKVVWTKLAGPGEVVFSDPNASATTASFCMPGKYVLQALAYDASFTSDEYIVVRVWPAAGRDDAYKTLFIGNSFSFYNGTVGYRYWEFAKQAGEPVGNSYAASPYVKMMTSPSKTFQYHWYELNSNAECTNCPDHVLPAPPTVNLTDFTGKNAQQVVRDGGWDVVFLHTQSSAPLSNPDDFFRHGHKFDRLIRRSGARTVFYQTWAYPAEATTLTNEETLLGNYEKLATETGAALSKVGRAFQDVRKNHGGDAAWPKGIYFSDGRHPVSFGTYLAGAVHYATVYGKSPEPLKLYPSKGDVPAPEMTTDMTRADLMRTIAAKLVPAAPLNQGM